MLSLEALAQINREAEEKHKAAVPLVLVDPTDVEAGRIHIPYIGQHVPEGWAFTGDTWFVDTTGVGKSYEMARTQEQFLRSLKVYVGENPGLGYAIYEKGEFQCHVGVYRRLRTRPAS